MTHVVRMELGSARCRIILSVCALLAIWVDPMVPRAGYVFRITPAALGVLVVHFVYSVAVYEAVARQLAPLARLASLTTWCDVAFATAIGSVAGGASSPFYVFFSFAVLAVGFRTGLRRTMLVTAVTVLLYLAILPFGPEREDINLHIVRPVYLCILGYLVGYMADERLSLEERVQELGAAAQRSAIARSLHDGYAQALAGINLRLETCKELLRLQRSGEALGHLAELQTGVTREYDDLRAYIRTLADLEITHHTAAADSATHISVRAEFAGPAKLVEHVLHIVREAITNVQRHAHARSAAIDVRAADSELVVRIEDDGVGFPAGAVAPWSIVSRVTELSGWIRLSPKDAAGAHIEIGLPLD